MERTQIEIILPLPVTSNKLTYNNNSKNGGKGGRSKTKRAKTWLLFAQEHAQAFYRQHRGVCTKNIEERTQAWLFGKKTYDLKKLHKNNMGLSYRVTYKYWFESDRQKLPRDIFNYEKQLSDFLVDMGFMLDDSFIEDGRVIRAGTDPINPRVEILIEVLDTIAQV